jgi:ceramide glucosyltransferase
MVAPADAIRVLRSDLASGGARLLTPPYVVAHDSRPTQLLDALFVNIEFYPGVLLLGHLDLVRFAFGSGMLFAAEDFARRVDWDFLGSCLAEDFHLGRSLAPTRLASTRFVTHAGTTSWRGALLHYLRWQKTVRWCRPGSFAAQLIILPVLGWLGLVLWQPTLAWAWAGLATVVALDAVAALSVSAAVGYPIRGAGLLTVPLWSLLRGLSWVGCWFPWPIVWRGHRWWTPHRKKEQRTELLESGRRARAD